METDANRRVSDTHSPESTKPSLPGSSMAVTFMSLTRRITMTVLSSSGTRAAR
ncbi:hypothetical protein D3C72_2599650 [compost metagenome]